MAYLEEIEFSNYAPPGISKEILKALQDNIENAINNAVNGEVLFLNSAGTNGDISLGADPNQYRRLKIYYGKEEAGMSSVEIPQELFSKTINLTQSQDAGNVIQIVEKKYIIDGTSLKISGTPTYINFTNSQISVQGPENMINIYKVLGYK